MPSQTQTWRPKPRRRSLLFARIDRAPITAVFCLLFIVCLVCQGLADQGSVHHRTVDLPIARSANSTPNALRTDAIQLMVDRTGRMFIGRSRMAVDDIPDCLRALSQPGVERRVYLKIDRQAKYGDVSIALDSIRAAGIFNITFMTDPFGRT